MADSASREMGISDARANMTEVISEVRLLGRPVVLTRREKPQAVLVSVDFHEQALRDRRTNKAMWVIVDRLLEANPDMETIGEFAQAMDELRAEQS